MREVLRAVRRVARVTTISLAFSVLLLNHQAPPIRDVVVDQHPDWTLTPDHG